MIKKILFLVSILFSTYGAMAQVNYFHGSLNEALETAKKENKTVLVIGSTSWCGPCKNLAEKILTTPEAGDYMNPRLIVMKTVLDKSDPDSLAKRYNITAYPTLVFLNNEGVEINRKLGGGSKAKDFIVDLERHLDPALSFQSREKRLLSEPAYAVEYAMYLNDDCRKYDRANEVLLQVLKAPQSGDFYSDSAMKLIRSMSHNINSPILAFFIDNKSKLCSEMGEAKYLEHMQYMGTSITRSLLSNKKSTDDNIRTVAKFMLDKRQKDMANDYTNFVFKNCETLMARDINKTIELIEKNYKKSSPELGLSIITSFGKFFTAEEKTENIDTFVKLFDSANEYYKDEATKKLITSVKSRFVREYSATK